MIFALQLNSQMQNSFIQMADSSWYINFYSLVIFNIMRDHSIDAILDPVKHNNKEYYVGWRDGLMIKSTNRSSSKPCFNF